MFEELVKKKEKQMLQNNLKDLRVNINNDDYQLKIRNYCEKFGFSSQEVKDQIMINDLVASFFIKDPAKQNFTEKLVGEILKTTTLPQAGKNCIRFDSNGDICSKKTPDTTKSADFYINNMYITQKYTRGDGGAQDNQYNDVIDFLRKGSIKHQVAAIVDGSFWDSKRDELKHFFYNNSNVKIFSMDEIMKGGVNFE